MSQEARVVIVAIVCALILVACVERKATPAASTDSTLHSNEIGRYADLLDALRATGAAVKTIKPIQSHFFSGSGQLIEVNHALVQVYEYADEARRQAESSTISPDGTSIGTSMISWGDFPYFWAAGRVIVLYVGREEAVVSLLAEALGAPIAQGKGRSQPGVDLPAYPDAQQYAQDMGVSLEEATRRLQYQDEIGELNAALTANERDIFAGLWVQHQPDFRVIVQFTRGGKRAIRPYVKDKPWADLVEVREVSVTLAELEGIYAETLQALDVLSFEVSCTLDVKGNRIEVWVTDREWFEDELRRAAIRLPDHVELVAVQGRSARDVDVCAPSPVPGVAFPRQAPVEGLRATMAAEMMGELVLVDGYLRVNSIYGDASYLAVWPPEYLLRAEDDKIEVLDGDGQPVARVGEEIYMDGGEGSAGAIAECARAHLPSDVTGPYWVVGTEVRPNLRRDSDLFALDVISSTGRSFLLLRHKPALDGWGEQGVPLTGKLVLYDRDRCLRVQGELTAYSLLWPSDYWARAEGGQVEIVDGAGQVVARVGEEVRLDGRGIPAQWDSDQYRQLLSELPGDCNGPYWIVDN